MIPSLYNHQISVYLFNDFQQITQDKKDWYLANLGVKEQKKYHRFHFNKDRELYLMAHTLLRLILSENLSCSPQSLMFHENKYGKPSLVYDSNISFNLSHSEQAVALVFTASKQIDLGIDIEYDRRRGQIMDLAANFFSVEEHGLISKIPKANQAELFFKLWTLKEAYIKAIGKGLSINLEKFSFNFQNQEIKIRHCCDEENLKIWNFYHTIPFRNYHLSIASRSETNNLINQDIKTFKLSADMSCVELPLNYLTSSQF